MISLRQLLKEYLELDEASTKEFIKQCELEWIPYLYEKLSDDIAFEVVEKLLGTNRST